MKILCRGMGRMPKCSIGSLACLLRGPSASQRLRDKKWACFPGAPVFAAQTPFFPYDFWLVAKNALYPKSCQVGTLHSPITAPFESLSLPVSHIQELWTKQRKNLPSSFEIYKIKTHIHCKRNCINVQFKSLVLKLVSCFKHDLSHLLVITWECVSLFGLSLLEDASAQSCFSCEKPWA